MKTLPLAVPHMNEAEAEEVTTDQVIERIMAKLPVP